MSELRLSPLHDRHEALGATFTPFGPWNMPLKYDNELDEHRAVRTAAGLFDLSHMGEIRVIGEDAPAYLDHVFISTLSTMPLFKAKYTMIVDESGGILDDLIVYRLGDTEFLVVPNAGNTDVVWEAMQARVEDRAVSLSNESQDLSLVAVQGPRAEEILLELVSEQDRAAVTEMKYYTCAYIDLLGERVLCARTGYTGEDGFEIITSNAHGPQVWDALLRAGRDHGIRPAGLAARDSLRLEAGMPLYGNELTRDITPVEAGMSAVIQKKAVPFVGSGALVDREPTEYIIGLRGLGRRAARSGAEVYLDDELIGHVTSGQPSPTLGYPIALALLRTDVTGQGVELEVDIRGKRHPFEIVVTPFYTRPGR
ncbi:glycine cleavage system aminomethyltransferase GcvT [Corynebacterium comes]|uniref:Aminomethyltransferase n=1 Tax=Corynebacterium comes TaxID=2675218 RepID=A0A6B8W2A0_9CORY|nr:glycine cleavage system aminomethyltransferase GcvT [Corynebacterium comes]QGU05046.1 Aminomethyltransferase [Corynebacterium comes]